MSKYYLVKEIAGIPVEKIEVSENELFSIPSFNLIISRMSGKSNISKNIKTLQIKVKNLLEYNK